MPRLLIIEDDRAILANLVRILTLEGYDTVTASNGADGVTVAIEQAPDLVICDLLMPQLDGDGVLVALRAHALTANTPLIFLTASADKSERESRLLQGAAEYLVKPFDLKELLRAVRRHLPASRESV